MRFAFLGVGNGRHPCQNDGVSQILVYNDARRSVGTMRFAFLGVGNCSCIA